MHALCTAPLCTRGKSAPSKHTLVLHGSFIALVLSPRQGACVGASAVLVAPPPLAGATAAAPYLIVQVWTRVAVWRYTLFWPSGKALLDLLSAEPGGIEAVVAPRAS
jgi:hypothetical protein